MKTLTLAELAAELDGEVVGDGSVVLHGVAGIREATAGDVTFIANSRYDSYLPGTRASAVIIGRDAPRADVPLIKVDNPYLAFQRAVLIFRPDVYRPAPGVHASAVVVPGAELGEDVSIGPHCVVERGARVGARTVLMAGCYIGINASVGEDGYLYPHVTVREECVLGARCIVHPGTVIGSDGFGFAFDAGRYHKVPQVGNVIVGDDVEIGANVTIDRATTDATRIGSGTKIENLVQIGHNVVIGEHGIVVAQVGISGSTRLEDYVTIAGQAGLIGHITIGRGAQVGAQSGVTKSVPAGAKVFGFPALPLALFKRINAYVRRLPDLFDRAKALEERVSALEKQGESAAQREEVR
jgi:UDP-3-O-[3-hydroxymyristoyl] glucosamine N-acyltransferase